MALPLNNTAEGQSAGVTVSNANSGTSGDAFDNTTIGANSSLVYQNDLTIHGSMAFKGQQNTGALTEACCGWGTAHITGTPTEIWGRVYIYFNTLPTTNPQRVIRVFDGDGATLCGAVWIDTLGKLRVSNGTGGSATTATMSGLTASVLYRVEFHCVAGGAGVAMTEGKVFAGEDNSSPLGTVSRQTEAGGTSTTQVRFGHSAQGLNASADHIYWLDDLNVNGTGYPGPSTPAVIHDANIEWLHF